ncbi:MAG: glycerol-3-phosphate dehydrogenase/oxidase [Nitriliruptorales bacterium]
MTGTSLPADPPIPAPVAGLPDREDLLDRAAASALDVLVVGGGITGVGVALDAAARGLSVALVERDDLASGTSSKSSKLVHGGLRYLQQAEFGLVEEGVRERNLLRRIAPHLVRPLGFALPVADLRMRAGLKAGLVLYDALAFGRSLRGHERLDTAELLRAVPGLVNPIGRGGYRYHDCQTDDARLTLQVAQAARAFGAAVVNHCEAVELLRFGDRVVGARVRDRLSGEEADVRARWVVSATGVWADHMRGLADSRDRPLLTPSKGIHLTFRSRDVRVRDAALIPSGSHDRRWIFVIPWGDQVIVGTTDEHFEGDLDRPAVGGDEAAYLVNAVNTSFGTDLSPTDAVGAWAGLRPLLRGASETDASRDLSRRHAIFEHPDGLVTITGGKLTTYRQMAEDVVDRLVAADGAKVRSVTSRLPLGLRGRVEHVLAGTRDTCRLLGVDPRLAGSLVHRHGEDAAAVAAFCAEHGEAEALVRGLPYLRGEVRWAVRHELARSLDDILRRRLRVALRDAAAGGGAVEWAAAVAGGELGWTGQRRDAEVETYLAEVAAERGVIPIDTSWRPTDGIAVRSSG